jgi:hypothetical protein
MQLKYKKPVKKNQHVIIQANTHQAIKTKKVLNFRTFFAKTMRRYYSTYLGLIGSVGVSTLPWRTCERLTE